MKKEILRLLAASIICAATGFASIAVLCSIEDENVKDEVMNTMVTSALTGTYDDSFTNLDMDMYFIMQNKLNK